MTIAGASFLKNPPVGGHIVYPYSDEVRAMSVVADYAISGLNNGDAVILILTASHCEQIDSRLAEEGFNATKLCASGQLQCADAAATLDRFMVDGKPDEKLFRSVIDPVIARAKPFGKVRGYGEMVSLLFVENHAAAHQLEEFWNAVIKESQICLLCTYALGGRAELAEDLCNTHSHFVV